MEDHAGNTEVWKWIIGIFGSILSGAALSGWVSRGVVEGIKKQISDINKEVENLKQNQSLCRLTLKDDIKEVVENAIQHALDNHVIESNGKMEEIRTKLEIITDRFERRQYEIIPPPHGERRDQ